MSFKEYSGERFADSPSDIYPVHAHRPEDGKFSSSTGRLLGWRMHFPSLRWAGSEIIAGVSLSEGRKIAELLFKESK